MPTTVTQGPTLVVESSQLAAVDASLGTQRPIPGSRMFEIKDALEVFKKNNPGEATFDASQGDGGKSLPGVPRHLLEKAAAMQIENGTGYTQPAGTEAFRRAVAETYWGLEQGWDWRNVAATQGGRDGLMKAYMAVLALGRQRRGDFVLVSAVPWVSYNWGPYGVGANVLRAPGYESNGWALSAQGIRDSVAFAREHDREVAMLVITSPDNPTGRTTPEAEQIELARAALESGVGYVLFDWIYHRISEDPPHDLNRVIEALGPELAERIIVLDGITKSLGGSNVRNAHLVASRELITFVQKQASHSVIPSFYSQAVAIAAIEEGYEKVSRSLTEPTAASRAIMRQRLKDSGLRHVIGNGYYAFVDVGDILDSLGESDTSAFGKRLGEDFGLAVVPGVYFAPASLRWVRFSYALPPARTAAALDRFMDAVDHLVQETR